MMLPGKTAIIIYCTANPDVNSRDIIDEDDNALAAVDNAVTPVIWTRLGSTPTVAATADTKALVVAGLLNSYYNKS